ncbi:MAG: hypothetical protein ACI965_001176 [Paraglaciecola sp.]|jgi:hypothetical protein
MDKDISLDYQWLDHKQKSQNLNFSLPKKQVNQQVHRKFVPDIAQQYVFIALHKAAKRIDPREARVNIQRHAQNIKVKVSSRSTKLIHKWQQSMQRSEEQAFDRYLADNYYSRFRTHSGQQGVKPDHLRYVAENRAPLLPLAQAVFNKLPQGSDARAYVNLMLSWVQSIPYNVLENRLESNGAGYLPPLSVVANNQGDCDSKSALMATLVRTLLPDVKLVMMYLPNHALLGISLPFRIHEQTFNIAGSDYLMMEPTGPALMTLGTIAPRSNHDIASGMYSYESIP